MSGSPAAPLDRWLDALERRHLASLTRQEFTRAVRALSARYVERRQQLPDRSPLDSAGKRAAFALFYAPLHYVVVSAVLEHFDAPPPLTTLVDLGCGTGVCGAAWAARLPGPPALLGVDGNSWAVSEARWNWATLGLHGRATRGDLLDSARRIPPAAATRARTGVVAGWAVNELAAPARAQLLDTIEGLVRDGATLLILEPLARGVTPWWPEWSARLAPHGVTDADVKCNATLPPLLAGFSESAGFRKKEIGVRVMTTLSPNGRTPR